METFVAQMDLHDVIVMGFLFMVGMVGLGYALLHAGKIACQHITWFRPAPVTLNSFCKSGARMRVYAFPPSKF